MELLNPWMLGLAASAVVPIVLHLIMRQNPKHFLFPALRFVQQRNLANRRRLRLRHLILLALRIALLCLLALAMARLTLHGKSISARAGAPITMAIVVDTSPAMDYQHQSQTRLEVAKEICTWLLSQVPPESRIAIFDTRSGGGFQIDLGAAKKRVEQLKTTVAPDNYLQTVGEALRQLKEDKKYAAKELYLVTDLSRRAWHPDAAATLQSALQGVPNLGVQVIDVGVATPQNTSLGDVRLAEQVLARNTPIRIRTSMARLGDPTEKTVQLNVRGPDGKMETREQKTVPLKDGQSEEIDFTFSQKEPGTHQGELRIIGRDSLTIDDQRFFTVEIKPAWPVLLAAPSPAEHYAFDLREALAPEPLRLENRARFQCEVVVVDQLAQLPLENYAAVALLDPGPLSTAVWEKLATYARGGGSVAVFLGRQADVANFNSPAAQAVLAGKLLQQARWTDGKVHLSPRNLQHGALAAFRPYQDKVPWQQFPVFRYWQLDEIATDAGAPMIEYSNGQPALFERILDDGIAVTMTTPISDELDATAWNTLATGLDAWPFVMLSNELFKHLVRSSDEQLNYVAATNLLAELQLRGKHGIPSYKLISPSEGSGEMRTSNADEPKIVVANLDEIGNYRVIRVEDKIDRGFSVNVAAAQSDLVRASEADVKTIFGETPFKLAKDREEISVNSAIQRVGREIFPLLIVIVAIVLAVEHVLANLFYRRAE